MTKEKTLIKTINMQNDCLFKAMMCSENNREMVVDLIHVITGISKNTLYNATYIGGEELLKRNITMKKQTTDMTIRIENNHQIIVEMNRYPAIDIFEKNTVYAFSKIVENSKLDKKTNRYIYPKILLINIDNFNKYHTDKPILEFVPRDEEGNIEHTIYVSIHLVLENILNSTYTIDNELKKFAKFLKNGTTIEELEKSFKGDEKYMAAIRTVEQLSTDPEFSGFYDIEEAHKQELYGVKEFGRQEGIQEGIQKGSKQMAIQTAKSLLESGIDIEIISKATNLSVEEINLLKAE